MKRSAWLPAVALLATAVAAAVWIGPAWPFSADDSAFYDALSDTSAFDATGTAGVAIDPLGGMRLSTDGTPTTSEWTSVADFRGTGSVGPLVGVLTLDATATGGELRLRRSDLALSLDTSNPVVVPTFDPATDAGDAYEVQGPAVVKVAANDYRMYYTGVAPNGYVQRIFEATSTNGVAWTKVKGSGPGGCVLDVGAPVAFDGRGLVRPTVVYDASSTVPFKMWYGALGDDAGSIGFARSADGQHWSKWEESTGTPGPVVRPSSPGFVDGYAVGEPSVSYDTSSHIFRMWYAAAPAPDVAGRQVGYATSTNTTSDDFGGRWSKGGVIGMTGHTGNWSKSWFSPGVWYDPAAPFVHNMLFAGMGPGSDNYKLVSADSGDGLAWSAGNIVLGNGSPGAWNENNVFWPSVLHELTGSPAYRIYYTGSGGAGDRARNAIGYATWSGGGSATDVGKALDRSAPNARFDSNQTANGCVFSSPATTTPYLMLYAGRAASDLQWRIGLATSADGSAWTKVDGTGDAGRKAVFGLGGAGAFDASSAAAPSAVSLDASGTQLAMLYEGTTPAGARAIGAATSTIDSLGSWRRAGQVFAADGTGFDAAAVAHPSVVRAGGATRMFYAGYDGATWRIGVATATVGVTAWSREASPVLAPGAAGEFDSAGVYDPVVVYDAAATPPFRMWYTAEDAAGVQRLAYATSAEGSAWTKHGVSIAPSQMPYGFDEIGIRASGAAKDAVTGAWHVYFDGVDRGNLGVSAGMPVVRWRRIGHASGSGGGYIPDGVGQYECVPTGTPAPGYDYEFRDFTWDSSVPTGTGARLEMSYYPAFVLPTGAPVDQWSRFISLDTTPLPRLPLTTQKVRWRVAFTREASATAVSPALRAFRVTWAPVHFGKSGTARSIPIQAASGKYVDAWKNLDVTMNGISANATATVSVVADDGQVLLGPLALGNGANSIPLTGLPKGILSLRMKFDFSGDGVSTAYLKSWQVSYSTTNRAPVADLRAQGTTSTVALAWTDPVYDGYQATRILRRVDGFPTGPNDASATIVAETSGTPGAARVATDTPLVNGKVYYYAAYTTDGGGWSPPAFAIGVPCPRLRSLTAAVQTSAVRLTWSAPTTSTALAGTWITRRNDAYPTGPTDPLAVVAGADRAGTTMDDKTAAGYCYYAACAHYSVTVDGRTYHAYSLPATAPRVRLLRMVSVEGTDRYGTSIATSKASYATGACDTIIVATGVKFPDALGAAALAGVTRAPVLLVSGTTLRADIKTEMLRVTQDRPVKRIYILGSKDAVTNEMETSIKQALGYPSATRVYKRLQGTNRYLTAQEVAKEVKALGGVAGGKVIVTTGSDFSDALLAGPVAFDQKMPIVLVTASLDATTKATITSIGATSAVIIGSTAKVSTVVENDLRILLQGNVTRPCAQADKYAQGVAVANWAASTYGFGWDGAGIATGENFPDALGASVPQGLGRAPLLLTPKLTLNTGVKSLLAAHKPQIGTVRFFGSTSAVSQAVRDAVKAVLK